MEAMIAKLFAVSAGTLGISLILYGVVSAFLDGETIRELAELNALTVAAGMGAFCLVG